MDNKSDFMDETVDATQHKWYVDFEQDQVVLFGFKKDKAMRMKARNGYPYMGEIFASSVLPAVRKFKTSDPQSTKIQVSQP